MCECVVCACVYAFWVCICMLCVVCMYRITGIFSGYFNLVVW